jgi:glycosyltransferase involved in cell wall biosynthesis
MNCYFDQQIFMSQVNGGISRYYFELIRRLGATGSVRPTLFAGFYISRLPLRSLKGCRVIGLPRHFKIGPLHRALELATETANRRLLRRLAPDVYHPTYYRAATPPPGTRMVVTVYDMIHEKFPHHYPGDDTAPAKRAACASADAVICISESARQDLLDLYPSLEAKTSVVHLAADPLFAAPSSFDSILPFPYGLFVGGRKGYKGFDVALEAWQEIAGLHPEVRWVCVGGGGFQPAELAEIKRRGLGDLVSQQTADDRRLAELYRGARVFVYPSRYEGFGLPILEAMACGCPVVCSRASSLPEVGGPAAGYFEPGDAGGLAQKLTTILENPAHRAVQIQAGYEQQRRFSWDECARQTAAVYQQCTT